MKNWTLKDNFFILYMLLFNRAFIENILVSLIHAKKFWGKKISTGMNNYFRENAHEPLYMATHMAWCTILLHPSMH